MGINQSVYVQKSSDNSTSLSNSKNFNPALDLNGAKAIKEQKEDVEKTKKKKQEITEECIEHIDKGNIVKLTNILSNLP